MWRDDGPQQGREGALQSCYGVLLLKIMANGGIQVKNSFVGDRRGADGTRETLAWDEVKRTDIVG